MNGYDLIPRLDRFQSYDEALRKFHPQLPSTFNIAEAVLSGCGDSLSRIAIVEEKPADDNIYTYGALDYLSNKFANALSRHRIKPGDRIAVMLPQSAALVVAHLGILKARCSVIPLAINSPEAIIEYTLKVTSPRALIISTEETDRMMNNVISLSSIESIFIASDFRSRTDFGDGYKSFWREVYNASPDFTIARTGASTPAFIFPPSSLESMKCVVHAHQSLIGQLPAFEMSNNFCPGDDTIFYTPSGWSDLSVLFGMLYPALGCGHAVMAGSDTNQSMMSLIERQAITNLFLSPDGLNQLLSEKSPRELKLKNIVISNSFDQGIEQVFNTKLSHIYSTRETGAIAASCHGWFPSPTGSQGRAIPGSRVEAVDCDGSLLPADTPGKIAAHKSISSLFLGYLDQDEKISFDSRGDWFVTNDTGWKDRDENLWIKR